MPSLYRTRLQVEMSHLILTRGGGWVVGGGQEQEQPIKMEKSDSVREIFQLVSTTIYRYYLAS